MAAGPERELRRFLSEDIGAGDVSGALLPRKRITGVITSKQAAILSGMRHARRMFLMCGCTARALARDGQHIRKGQHILRVTGTPQAVLSCERTALNLLSRMSGIATQTGLLVAKSSVPVFATRKTAPGLRAFDKEAVKAGGGHRHRMALDESVMLKDNHIAVGGLAATLKKAKKRYRGVEVEVEGQDEAILAARLGADIILLDNFTPGRISRTIRALGRLGLREGVILEASGRITASNVARFAASGVDRVSAGSITHSVQGIDYTLEVVKVYGR